MLKELIFDLADQWNKTSKPPVPYQFITWLISQLEKRGYENQ